MVSAAAATEQVANALVSWIGWNALPCGFVYVRTSPVRLSNTVRSTRTSVNPPANVQNLALDLQPSSTLISISTLAASKKVKYPVSLVSATAWPRPLWPPRVNHSVVTRKRPSFRHNAVALETHGSAAWRYSKTPPPVPA